MARNVTDRDTSCKNGNWQATPSFLFEPFVLHLFQWDTTVAPGNGRCVNSRPHVTVCLSLWMRPYPIYIKGREEREHYLWDSIMLSWLKLLIISDIPIATCIHLYTHRYRSCTWKQGQDAVTTATRVSNHTELSFRRSTWHTFTPLKLDAVMNHTLIWRVSQPGAS